MYLAIAGVALGLILLACYLIKRAKCCKRRRETAAANHQPPVGMAKRGPVPGMVIIPSRNPNHRGPGAPPRSHMSTHVNQAFSPHFMGDPLGANGGPMRPNDEAYFQTGPGVAPVPPVYHGQSQQYPQWPSQGMPAVNDPGPDSLPAAGGPHPVPLPPPMGVPPPVAPRPPAYDSLYPKEEINSEPVPRVEQAQPQTQGNPGPPQEAHTPAGQDSLTKDLGDLLGSEPTGQTRPPTQASMQVDSQQPSTSPPLDTSDPSNTTELKSLTPPSAAQENASKPGDLDREKTLGMEDLERMLLPDTPVPQQTTEL